MDRNFVAEAKSVVQEMFADKRILVRYARNEHGAPTGVVVGVKTENGVVVGHSRCNTKKDNFNKYVGIYIAVQRALAGKHSNVTEDLRVWYDKMYARGAKYWNKNELVNV